MSDTPSRAACPVAGLTAWRLRCAVRWLRQGGVIAYPTEAVFGLGCHPRQEPALRLLLQIKRRDWRKGLILIGDDVARLRPYLRPVAAELEARAQASWPGAVTWVWPVREEVSPLLRGMHTTLAVRVPAHPVARALCQASGEALVSTSANRAAQPPARSALEVRRRLGARAPVFILAGEVNRAARPSRIIDLISQRTLRA